MGWIINFNVLSLLIGGVIGAFLSALYGFYLKRPVLRHVGGSGGGGAGVRTTGITIRNMPGFIGLRLSETAILGLRIFDEKEWGLTFDRNPARDCFATLYDHEDDEPICSLWWQLSGGNLAQTVDIASGEQKNLKVFARLGNDQRKYFAYQSNRSDIDEPRIPEEEDRFNSTRHFYILITYSYGKSKFRIDCTMNKRHDGRLYFTTKSSSSSF